jgi:hypothetical protein
LAIAQIREQNNVPIRKLHGIVVCVRVIQIDFPKPHQLSATLLSLKEPDDKWSAPLHIVFKRKLGTGQQANCNPRLVGCGKTARSRGRE